MRLTDTHTHLYSEAFDEDREVVVQRAMDAGVQRFFLPAIDHTYYPAMKELEQQFPGKIFLMAGLHPTHVKEDFENELKKVEEFLQDNCCVAIGEIGIDLYWDKTHIEEQKEAFARQIQLAAEQDLPIVIHCRESFDEIFEVLEAENNPRLRGIFHCFTGTLEQAERAIGFGMKLGIGGVVTFKNGGIDKFLAEIPLEHIVLETDSPYLAPKPFRGKRNESSYLLYITEKLAEIYDRSQEEIAAVTTSNANQIFGLEKAKV